MFIVTTAEMNTLTARLRTLGAQNLALLYLNVLGEDAAHTLTQPPLTTVLQLAGRIGFSAEAVIATCDWLVVTFPSAHENAGVVAITDRLRAQAALRSANPVDELWIGAEPMVNRTGLREILRDICDRDCDYGVIYVAGATASGRTHSKHLIRHVATKRGIRCYIADFHIETEARTLGHLYDHLKAAYRLDALDVPIHQGATPGDVAFRFAARLRARLQVAPEETPKPWVVIDFTDEVIDPAIAEFIGMLCAERLSGAFVNCVIFVLGPTAHLETLRGLPALQIEELGRLTRSEIETAAKTINQRGQHPLDPSDLDLRIDGIVSLATIMPEERQNGEIRSLLLDLRREVRAP
ncbi:hypothetical protein [Sinorhizobium meliloti]|uniref:Uncharacterized protein n=1 Tax=Rhizobium meliloti TaxID=382 RepID=A0A2J0YT03_RHIML|nr:hypothetical protein [Sinorhizobium meliloti]PJR08740.1 hypothetical protein CEJ86_32495 [Sinorhizobium meliloti]